MRVGHEISDPIQVRQGVKQGDPLSCFLFNLVIDSCVKELDSSLGVELNREVRVSHMAFADDVVLLAENSQNLQRLLTAYTEHLNRVGLEVNPRKCATVDIRVHKRKDGRRWVVQPSILSVKDQAIPSLAAGETYKYLGIRVETSRCDERRELYSACTESITKWLQNVTSAPLEPQQRMKSFEHICCQDSLTALSWGILRRA